jgi:hypothetical protein
MATKSTRTVTKAKTKKNTPIVIPKIEPAIEGRDFIKTRMPNAYFGKTLYKIEYEMEDVNICVNYVDTENKHVIFKDKDDKYLYFHMDNTPNVKIIEKAAIAITKPRRVTTRHQDLAKDAVILQSCVPAIDLSIAQHALDEMNAELDRKCPEFELKLAPFYEYNEPMTRYSEVSHVCIGCNYYDRLILALCKPTPDKKCISTIELIISPTGEVSINSKTDTTEEGKKYNKMLRAVLSAVTGKIPDVSHIKSTAINPISAWLLLKYSNAEIKEGDPFKEFVGDRTITKDIINEYFTNVKKEANLIVPLNAETAAKARADFTAMVAGTDPDNEIRC